MHGQFSYIIIAALAGACAWAYSARLTDAGMILNWWYVWCDNTLPSWIAKPICTCYKCVAGQWGLWAFLWQCELSIAGLIAAPCISIITALTLNRYVGNGETENN